MRNKNYWTAFLLFSTLMTTGCDLGEADYSFADVKSIYAPVVDEFLFITPDTMAVQENENDVTTIRTSTDQDITYGIIGGNDAALFTIDPTTGKLTFINKPLYIEGGDNSYEVTIEAKSDDGHTSLLPLTVTVVQDLKTTAPIIEAFVSEVDAISGAGTILQIKARPADETTTLTYAVTGVDADRFQIDANGNLSFAGEPPLYESGIEKVYAVSVIVTDGYGNAVTTGSITVRLVENPDRIKPVIVSENFAIVENALGAAQIEVSTAGTGIVNQYYISGPDAALFNVTASGIVHLVSSNDYETLPNSFNIDLQVGDDKGNLSGIKAVTVSIIDVDEGFIFAPISGFTPLEGAKDVGTIAATPKIEGNTHYTLVQGGETFTIDDEGHLQFIMTAQRGQSYNLQVQVENQYNGSQTLSELFSVTVADDISKIAPVIDPDYDVANTVTSPIDTAAVITTVSASAEGNATALSYTTAGPDGDKFSIDEIGNLRFKAAYDYDAAADADGDNLFEVTVFVTDDNGNSVSTQPIIVELLPDPDKIAPVIVSSTFNVIENSTGEMLIAVSAEGNGIVDTYSIVGGADASKFQMNNSVLRFAAAPDFESASSYAGSNRYRVELQVRDNLGNASAIKEIIVNVLDVDETLQFTSLSSFTPTEGTTAVGTIQANGKDATPVSVSYTLHNHTDVFSLDADTGALRFIAPAVADGYYELSISAQSQFNGSLTYAATVYVDVAALNYAITFTSQDAATLPQNSVAEVAVEAVSAAGREITYAMAEGTDTTIFTIDASTGVMTVKVPAYTFSNDPEANIYRGAVVASDDMGHSAIQQGELHIEPVDGIPQYTSSATVTVDENKKALPAVTADSPIGSPLQYTIDGGADSALFTISTTGALSFTYAQNFENPQDQNRDNVYEVNIRVTDTLHTINTALQSVYVTVEDTADAPSNIVFDSTGTTSLSVDDGTYLFVFPSNTVTYAYVVATPSPSSGVLNYTIVSNPDTDIFSMTSNGQLKIDAPPFSSDQHYAINVEVAETNGESSTQTLDVTILD